MRQLTLLDVPPKRRTSAFAFNPKEFKVQALRECPTPAEMQACETPDKAAAYWREHISSSPYFDPETECLVALLLNTRRKIKGHHLVSIGTRDTLLVLPSSVFRVAVTASAAGIVLMHNHPSGEPQPSEADIKVTRDLIRAGQLLKIEVLDHVVMGQPTPDRPEGFVSLRALGYFFA
jgi:DNA repair protein RadC